MIQLLSLPHEVILQILQHLPSSSLLACISAHPTFERLIVTSSFLDSHARRTLGLPDKRDSDVKYELLPDVKNPQMKLWFLAHNAMLSIHDHSKSFIKDGGLFFLLECLRHSQLTWLVQAVSPQKMYVDLYGAKHVSSELMFQYISHLPKGVIQVLTKLTLAFPRVLTWTILSTCFSLHRGRPAQLKDLWHEGFSEEFRTKFDPEFCMEIICGQTTESFAKLAAMAVLFCEKNFVVWTGSVAQFPGCKFEETWTLVCLDMSSDVTTIAEKCGDAIYNLEQRTTPEENVNSQWKRQNFYPGVCHDLHQAYRSDVIASIHKKQIQVSDLLGGTLQHRHKLKTASIPDLLTAEIFLHNIYATLKQNQRHLESRRGLHDHSPQTIRRCVEQQVGAWFRDDILPYVTDHETHQVLCRRCGQLWFPSRVSIEQCVAQFASDPLLPYELWPLHTLVDAKSVLTAACQLLSVVNII
ncbi:uncharacterized protein LOC131946183 [Physella acuta]|uniref:uncharacterized protein LOC131946183 n=1 Tax=Physella acuta TaxID=109671 RepID=UPI0027DEA14E|nr:uncharacterized protein LOC131946183 [Physella acuta]XP_059162819.1 uncharacterized protein LOC131946183 [Physella acuta]